MSSVNELKRFLASACKDDKTFVRSYGYPRKIDTELPEGLLAFGGQTACLMEEPLVQPLGRQRTSFPPVQMDMDFGGK